MSIGAIIRQRREQLQFTQDHLALRTGISKPYLSNIETGKAKNPPTDNVLRALERSLGFEGDELTKLAHMARTPPDIRNEHELLAAEVQKLRGVLKEFFSQGRSDSRADLSAMLSGDGPQSALSAGLLVPVINKASDGYPHNFPDLDYPAGIANEYVRCVDLHDTRAFAARISGDSMEPAYKQGDVVIFSPQCTPVGGNDCFVRFSGGGTTFKRYYRDNEQTVRLQPLNGKYPAEVHRPEEITGLWPAVFRIEKLRELND